MGALAFSYQFNFSSSIDLSNFIESFLVQFKLSNFISHFPTSVVLSNFGRFFPTSPGSFQLRSVPSNFAWLFPTSLGSFQLRPNFPTSDFPTSNFPTSRSFQLAFPTTRIRIFSMTMNCVVLDTELVISPVTCGLTDTWY